MFGYYKGRPRVAGGFCGLVRVDENGIYYYSPAHKEWMRDYSNTPVWEDMDYVKIDKEAADKIVEEWRNK